MTAVDETVEVAKGWTVPFFPMRPATGRTLSKAVALEILEKQENHEYFYQPKLNGDRALLAVVDRQVIVCNRHFGWYHFQIQNAALFLKLGNGTLFDGEVAKHGHFYPFECLALEGHSYKASCADLRAMMAYQMCRFLKIEWVYPKPTKKWLLALSENAPLYDGVVRKRADSPYVLQTSATAVSSFWLKHRWI